MNLREQYTLALAAIGEREVKRTFRYIVFSRKAGGYYYLGRAGSLRFGYNIRGSRPVSDIYKAILLAKAKAPHETGKAQEVGSYDLS